MSGGSLETGFRDFGGVYVLEEVVGGFVFGALLIEAFEAGEIILEPGLLPLGDIFGIE